MGADQTALAVRQTGLLDAYTESANTAATESDKFKEGYKKKGKGKTRDRPHLSESEPEVPAKDEPEPQPEPEEVESWDDGVVESWEDIEATDIPLPSKVKQEMRKQEKQRKKQEQDKIKGGKDEPARHGTDGVDTLETNASNLGQQAARTDTKVAEDNVVPPVAERMSQLSLSKECSPSSNQDGMRTASPAADKGLPQQADAKTDLGDNASSSKGEQNSTPNVLQPPQADVKVKKDLSPEEQAAIKVAREAQKAAKAAAKAAATQKKAAASGAAAGVSGTVSAPEAVEPVATARLAKEDEKPTGARSGVEGKQGMKGGESGPGGVGSQEEASSELRSKAELKAERRAKQEAQRAAKSQAQDAKSKAAAPTKIRVPDEIQADQKKVEKKLARTLANQNLPARTLAKRKVPLFSHLLQYEKENSVTRDLPLEGGNLHPAVIELGIQLSEGKVSSSEERCTCLLSALKLVILDGLAGVKDVEDADIFKEIENLLKPNINFLKQCRPLSISMGNAVRSLKTKIKSLERTSLVEETRSSIADLIDEYVQENIILAAQQISHTGGNKIQNGDVILTYSDSSLIEKLLVEAAVDKKFKVIVSDGRVQLGGKRLAARLSEAGIDTTYIFLTAVSQVLSTVTKVFVGCEGVMANGCVLGPVGTSQVALLAQSAGLPVLVCCETYKFTERVQTDSFVYNELSDPDDLIRTDASSSPALENWRELESLCLLNLVYDLTPASLVTAVITELSVIPTTSVPVILRLKHTEGHFVS